MVEVVDDGVSNLIVALRIRPISDDEIYNGATPIAHKVDDNMIVLMDPLEDSEDILRQNRSREKQYIYDIVLDASSTQEEAYNKTCKALIPSVINGYNTTCFAYGATGAGKTHTMLGRDDSPGIMALALTELFEQMNNLDHEDMVYKVSMSYLEIYNEMIRDLLNTSSGFLDLREDSKGVQVAGLSEHTAASTEQVMVILKEGNKQRTQEPTAANKTSSRSHAILIISVKQRNRISGIKQQVRVGKLFLIDLAGSERASNTQNRGKRMVEGAHINRSLLALGNCINALSDKSGGKYVNYRDSKLTRLLKDALGGNCKTVMIGHISPASHHFEESRNTLSYADRAKNIRTKVRQNVLDMTLHISQYSNIITDLREEIKKLKLRLEQNTFTKNLSTLNAIQNEVMFREDAEVGRLRDEMEEVHNCQIQLGIKMTQLIKQQSQIELENTKLQLMVNSFGQSRIENNGDSLPELFLENKKKTDKGDLWSAIDALKDRRKNNEAQINHLNNQLNSLSSKLSLLRESLNKSNMSLQQKELFNLLNKMQIVQEEKVTLQRDLIRQAVDLKKRDLVLMSLVDYSNLTDDIIVGQQKLIDLHDLGLSDELKRLQACYKQVGPLKAVSFLPSIQLSNSVTNSDKDNNNLYGNQMDDNPVLSNRLLRNNHLYDNGVTIGNKRSNRDSTRKRFLQSPIDSSRSMSLTPSVAMRTEIEDMIMDVEDKRNIKQTRMQIHNKRRNKPIEYPLHSNRSKYDVESSSIDVSLISRKQKTRRIFEPKLNKPNETKSENNDRAAILFRLKQQQQNQSLESKSKDSFNMSINGHALK